MKAKWLWLLIPVALAILLAVFWRRPGGGGQISTRLVGRTLDSTGRVHILYEVTNGTSSAIDLRTSLLEERHERTGWWDVDKRSANLSGGSDGWLTAWHIEKRAGVAKSARQVTLNPGGAAQLDVLAPRLTGNGSAVRGKLWQIKLEGRAVTQVRSIASHLGLPRRWLMWPKPGLIDLPEAELAAVTSAAKTPTPPEIVVQGSAAVPVGAQGAEELLPPGGIRFRQTGLQMVLDIYADLAQARLEIDPRVRALNARISLETTQALSRADAVRLLERAINEQAGVAFKRSQKDGIEVTLEEGAKTNTNREH